jgi:hypothetical protein
MRSGISRLGGVLALLTVAGPLCAGPVTQPPTGSGGSVTTNPAAPAYAAGFWYPSVPGPSATGGVGNVGNVRLEPFVTGQAFTIDQVGVLISTAAATGGRATIYVYGANATGNRPGGLPIGQCELTTVTSTGVQACTFASPVSLIGNRVYWFGWEINSSATTLVAASASSASGYPGWIEGMMSSATILATQSLNSKLTLAFGNNTHGYGVASDPSAYSPAMVEIAGVTNMPLVFFRVASLP